jgi:hypothetical protein
MTQLKGNVANLVIGLLLIAQATIASYGLSHVHELATGTRAQLAAVARATR